MSNAPLHLKFEKDEWYPVFKISEDYVDAVGDFTEDEFRRIKQAMEEFIAVQDLIIDRTKRCNK